MCAGHLRGSPRATLTRPALGAPRAPANVHGDGFADVAIGSTWNVGAGSRAYVYLGSAAGLSDTPTTTLVEADELVLSVASAGDVDGDGFADVLVSGFPAGGQVYLYRGGASGLATSPASRVVAPDPTHTLTEFFGAAVAGVGDVDGDGFADVLVGAPGGVAMSTAHAYLFRGSAAGLVATPAATLAAPDGAGSGFGFSIASRVGTHDTSGAWGVDSSQYAGDGG